MCCCPSMRAAVLQLRVWVLRACAAVTMLLSLIVVAAEITVPASGQQSLVGYVVKENYDIETGVFVWTLLVFGYMSICTYVSFMSLSLPIPGTDVNSRNIVSNHLSSPYALMLFGTYLCRMQFALGYHFLNIMQYDGEPQELQPSAFKRLYMANGDVSGLGIDWFFAVFPIGVVVMFFLVLSHAYSYCLVHAGMGSPEDVVNVEGVSQSTSVLAGRGLLRSEMTYLKKKEAAASESCCSCFGFFGASGELGSIRVPDGGSDEEMGGRSAFSNGTTIQIGKLKHRDSWGEDALGDAVGSAKKMTTVTIGADADERRRRGKDRGDAEPDESKLLDVSPPKKRVKRYKVGDLEIRGSGGGFFGGSKKWNEHWVEIDTVSKEFKWFEGSDSSGTKKGHVILSPGSITVRDVGEKEAGRAHAFEVVDGPQTTIFAAHSDEERYGWTSTLRNALGMRSPSLAKLNATPEYDNLKSAILYREERSFFKGTKGAPCFVKLNVKTKTLVWYEGRSDAGDEIERVDDLTEYRTRAYVGTASKMKHGFELVSVEGDGGKMLRFAAPNERQQKDWIDALTDITGAATTNASMFEKDKEPRIKSPSGGGRGSSIDDMTSVLDDDVAGDGGETDFLKSSNSSRASAAAATSSSSKTSGKSRNALVDALDAAEDARDDEADILNDW
eukprot:g4637.t1